MKLDKKHIIVNDSAEKLQEQEQYWADKTFEERFLALEFLRHQWMEWNKLSSKMEKSIVLIRKADVSH
jgi:hypothetical protein